jgi:hypothetical protein
VIGQALRLRLRWDAQSILKKISARVPAFIGMYRSKLQKICAHILRRSGKAFLGYPSLWRRNLRMLARGRIEQTTAGGAHQTNNKQTSTKVAATVRINVSCCERSDKFIEQIKAASQGAATPGLA